MRKRFIKLIDLEVTYIMLSLLCQAQPQPRSDLNLSLRFTRTSVSHLSLTPQSRTSVSDPISASISDLISVSASVSASTSASASVSASTSASVSVQSCWATDKLRGVSEKVKVSDLCQDLHPVEKSSESPCIVQMVQTSHPGRSALLSHPGWEALHSNIIQSAIILTILHSLNTANINLWPMKLHGWKLAMRHLYLLRPQISNDND